jgi:hypothetical protein
MMRRARLGLLFSLFLTSAARAAVPTAVTVQGVLRDSAGRLQSMSLDVTVNFFDGAASPTLLAGPYTTNGAMVVNGLFSVAVDDAALAAKLAAASEAWLQITAGSDVFPRQRVSADVFAQRCSAADSLSGILPVASGGTGSATQNFVDLTTVQTIAGNKTFSGTVAVDGALQGKASVTVDQGNNNSGTLASGSLTFGSSGTEGIQSKRTATGNQNGLDFFTNNLSRLAITSAGAVTIPGNVTISANLTVTGTKNFVVPHPHEAAKEIYYVALEGPEAGTYCRGNTNVTGPLTRVRLPDTFRLVTSERGITAQVTAVGRGRGLYVAKTNASELVVGCDDRAACPKSFNWLVNGVRKGYDDYAVVRDKAGGLAVR